MANPYKKADQVKRVPPTGQRKEDPPVTPPVVEETPKPVVETPTTPTPAPVATTSLADMIEPKPEGKSCGFYLSSEAIKKLDKAAKQLKCSKSKALDLLIRKYL